METKIGKIKTYDMFYDSHEQMFVLRNSAGEEVASGKTQDELEKQADKLARQDFTFPIRAIKYRGSRFFEEGRVTSLNISDRSVWFCQDRGYRGKERLSYDPGLYELTEYNAEIVSQIREHQVSIKVLEGKISELAKRFERPIDLKYFNLE